MIESSQPLLHMLESMTMAALTSAGFAVLFSTPKSNQVATAALAALGMFIRLMLINYQWGLFGATFVAAISIGLLSMVLSWRFHSPCIVFSLPAVIPMVPGVFAYRTMLGILEFIRVGAMDPTLLTQIFSNGLNTAFLFLGLSVGISFPNLLLRGKSLRSVFGLYKLAGPKDGIYKS